MTVRVTKGKLPKLLICDSFGLYTQVHTAHTKVIIVVFKRLSNQVNYGLYILKNSHFYKLINFNLNQYFIISLLTDINLALVELKLMM